MKKRTSIFVFCCTVVINVCQTSSASVVSNAIYDVNGTTVAEDPMSSSTSVDSMISQDDVFARVVNVAGVNSATVEGIFFDGSPLHTVTAETAFSEMITNTGPTQAFFYDFFLTGPMLETLASGNIPFDPQRPRSSYFFEVKVNGVPKWTSSATLSSDFDDFNLTDFGTDLGGAVNAINDPSGLSGFRASFNNYDSSVLGPLGLPLGTFAVGATFEFETVLKVELQSFGLEAGGTAAVGDPGNIIGVSGTITTGSAQNTIPEPSTFWVVVGIGLVGLAFGWRRRRK